MKTRRKFDTKWNIVVAREGRKELPREATMNMEKVVKKDEITRSLKLNTEWMR
jgi:hypothetical protein